MVNWLIEAFKFSSGISEYPFEKIKVGLEKEIAEITDVYNRHFHSTALKDLIRWNKKKLKDEYALSKKIREKPKKFKSKKKAFPKRTIQKRRT